MPGTIIGAEAKRRIAECNINAAKLATNRKELIEIYKCARLTLVKGTLFDSVVAALSERAKKLGVAKERTKDNA